MNVIEYLENNNSKAQIISFIRKNLGLFKGIDSEERIDSFTGSLYNIFVTECVQNNQYISLSNKSMEKVNAQYRSLIGQLKKISEVNEDEEICRIVEEHRGTLINILKGNQYSESIDQLLIPCAEYSETFQSHILRIDRFRLLEPILDIGCGKNYTLVKLLKSKGYDTVLGIDQYEAADENIVSANWLDFEFKENTFGTIISHMAFTNHFYRSLCFNDRKVELYREKYSEILNSLKKHGKFIYAPGIRIIENRLDSKKYTVTRYKNMNNENLDTTVISKR